MISRILSEQLPQRITERFDDAVRDLAGLSAENAVDRPADEAADRLGQAAADGLEELSLVAELHDDLIRGNAGDAIPHFGIPELLRGKRGEAVADAAGGSGNLLPAEIVTEEFPERLVIMALPVEVFLNGGAELPDHLIGEQVLPEDLTADEVLADSLSDLPGNPASLLRDDARRERDVEALYVPRPVRPEEHAHCDVVRDVAYECADCGAGDKPVFSKQFNCHVADPPGEADAD